MPDMILEPAVPINLPEEYPTVLLDRAELVGIIQEIKRIGTALDELNRDLMRFKVFSKTGEVDDLKERIDVLEDALIPVASHKQADRGDMLRALLAANGGKMPAKVARQKMNLSKSVFSRLLATMTGYLEVRDMQTDRRADILILRCSKN